MDSHIERAGKTSDKRPSADNGVVKVCVEVLAFGDFGKTSGTACSTKVRGGTALEGIDSERLDYFHGNAFGVQLLLKRSYSEPCQEKTARGDTYEWCSSDIDYCGIHCGIHNRSGERNGGEHESDEILEHGDGGSWEV